MGKSKKKRQQDFQKVKLKVGRKLKKGDNVTNASFKTRTVQISQKLKTGQTTEPSTRKKQNITELLSQCRHYNTSVRLEAVTGLRELVINFPGVVDQHLAAVLEKSAELFIDKDATVRQGVIRLLRAYLPKVTQKQISPFFSLLCAHLCCAMTHIYDDIQVDSLSVLDILLETFPYLMVSKSSQVLTNFIDQISRQQSQGHDKGSRSLSVNPNSRTSSLKWRTSVFKRLEKFLVAILDSRQDRLGSPVSDSTKQEVIWSPDGPTSIENYPLSLKHSWEASSFTSSTFSVSQASESDGLIQGKFHEFVTTLIPLLIACWIESVPSKQTSIGAGNLLQSDSVGIIVSILNVTQSLGECASLYKTEGQETFVEGKHMKDCQQHFLAGFPYSLHESAGRKDKSDRTDQISAESINLTICDIMTQFLTNQRVASIPTWLPDIVTYLKDFLQGKYKSKMLGQSSKVIVKILKRFILLDIEESSVQQLLKFALLRYKGAHYLSAEKKVYLKFFSEVCLTDHKPGAVCENDFLSTLPELLTLVVIDNQEMAAMVIATMKRAACQNCAGVLDLISRHSLIWFSEGNNSFLSMDTWCRQEVLSLLFFLPTVDAKLYECLFKLTRRLDMGDAELDFMLQVLHHRYVKNSKDANQAVLYMGFLSSLLAGHTKREDVYIKPSNKAGPCLGKYHIQDVDFCSYDDKGRSWSRHVYVVQKVCDIVNQCENQEQVCTVIKTVLNTLLRSVMNTRLAYGICKFAEMDSDISFCKDLCFSIIQESVLREEEKVVPTELLDLALNLVLKNPDSLVELLGRILKELKNIPNERIRKYDESLADMVIPYIKVCLLFLSEKRIVVVKQMNGCKSALNAIIIFQRELLSRDFEGKPLEPRHEKTFTELEYLVSTI